MNGSTGMDQPAKPGRRLLDGRRGGRRRRRRVASDRQLTAPGPARLRSAWRGPGLSARVPPARICCDSPAAARASEMPERRDRDRAPARHEAGGRVAAASGAQQRRAAADRGVHRVLAAVESMRLGQPALALEFAERVLDVVLRQTHQAEQPMQSERRIALAASDLPILTAAPCRRTVSARSRCPRATWTIADWK